jgi:hypothetical protein
VTDEQGESTESHAGEEPPANNQNPQPSITERLVALGWQWNKQGVLVQPKDFEGCKLSEDRDFIGSRYSVLSRGHTIHRRSGKTPSEEVDSADCDDTEA